VASVSGEGAEVRIVADRAGGDRRDPDGWRRDAPAAVAHADSAVPARLHHGHGTYHVGTGLTIDVAGTYHVGAGLTIDVARTHHVGTGLTIDVARTHHVGTDLTVNVAGALHPAEIDRLRTASHLANPKRVRAHLAAAPARRLRPLDWSDYGPPFR
jgi:hypothetical protein